MATPRTTIRLPLPSHRIRPGAVVGAAVPGRRLRFELPPDVHPGTVLLDRSGDPEVAVVITLLADAPEVAATA